MKRLKAFFGLIAFLFLVNIVAFADGNLENLYHDLSLSIELPDGEGTVEKVTELMRLNNGKKTKGWIGACNSRYCKGCL